MTSLLIGRRILRSNPGSFKAAMLFFLGIVSVVFYLFIPTAAYFMIYPTIALSIYYYINSQSDQSKLSAIASYISSIIPLALWLPVITLFFLAFSLVGLPMPTIHVAIIALSTMVIFDKMWTSSAAMTYLGLATIIISMAGGHLTSAPTAEQPLPSELFYNYNTITDEAHVATIDKHINIGNQSYLSEAQRSQLQVPYKRTYWNVATDIQPSVSMPQVVYDTIQPNIAHIINKDEVYNTRLHIAQPANVKALYINGEEVFTDRELDESVTVEAFGMIADTMTIRIEKRDSDIEQVIGVNSNYAVLPLKDILPPNALRSDAYTGIVYEVKL